MPRSLISTLIRHAVTLAIGVAIGRFLPYERFKLYDYTKSTELNHCQRHWEGEHADLRPLLDYTWHGRYTPARIKEQDRLIERFYSNAAHDAKEILPWVLFTGGSMGAGKGYVLKWMAENGHLPLDRFVVVDPDAIRQALPEWGQYVKIDCGRAGEMTQKEAGLISELLGYKALRNRLNVLIDGSLGNCERHVAYFARLRKNYPGVRIGIMHVVASPDIVRRRVKERAEETGRFVPSDVLEKSLQLVAGNVQTLAPLADFVFRVRNDGDSEPCVEREPVAPFPSEDINVSWEMVRRLWEPLDFDNSGCLDKEEVEAAKRRGILTDTTLRTVDFDGDGAVSREDWERAQQQAISSGTVQFVDASLEQKRHAFWNRLPVFRGARRLAHVGWIAHLLPGI